jgi:hypothetical protein
MRSNQILPAPTSAASLGTDPTADLTSGARQEVFVVELKK